MFSTTLHALVAVTLRMWDMSYVNNAGRFLTFVFFTLSPVDRICTRQAVYVIEAAFLYFNSTQQVFH